VTIVASDAVTDTGSRCVTTNVASGKTSTSTGNCSRCCGDFSTHRVPPRWNWQHCSTFFMYRYDDVWSWSL
jgi:hypothetical protein